MSVDLVDGVAASTGYLDAEAAAFWEAPEPAWVRDAYTAALREDLASATTAPLGRGALALISLLDPEQLAATARRAGVEAYAVSGDDGTLPDEDVAGSGSSGSIEARAAAAMLLDGVVVAQRLINHVHAIQQELIAAFCRPGVALPLADLLDVTGNDLGVALAAALEASADADEQTGPVTADARPGDADPADLLARPGWAGVLREAAVKAASAEIGCALHLAPVTARMRCETALDMVDHYPATVAGQHAGDIDPYRARLVGEALAVLPRDLRPVVERRVLPAVTTGTTAALRRLIAREVIAADPAAAEERVARAKAGRTVYTSRGEHNTGIFTAVISAADAELASTTLDAIADTCTTGHPTDCHATDGRTHAQLRADAFTDLFRRLATTGHVAITGCAGLHTSRDSSDASTADPDPGVPGAAWCGASLPTGATGTIAAYRRPVALNVYLDVATLAGLDDRPGELAGHGAITADTARALAASADTIRAILIRPAGPNRTCETILDAGRAVYRPPDRTADHVVARDRTCAFPGCRVSARRCDLDHRQPFDSGGDTCPCNLDTLCRTHHRLKTFTGWAARPDPGTGRLTWTSPLGRHFPTEQAHLLHDRAPEPSPRDGSGPPGAPDPAVDPPPF